LKSIILSLAVMLAGQTPLPPKAVTAPAPPVVTTPAPAVPAPAPVAAAPAISGPTTIQEHTLTSFSVPGFSSVSWVTIPAISTDPAEPDGHKLDVTAAPGSYTILAAVIYNGQPVILQQILTVQGAPQPSTTPTPQSPTTATPPVKTPGVWVVGIFDPATLTQIPAAQLAIHDSRTIHKSIEALGAHYREMESTQLNHAWQPVMAGVKLPALAAVDATGKFLIGPEPMPADEAAVVAAVKAVVTK
jgi:hypothetical protein